jgi:hypothetical protein
MNAIIGVRLESTSHGSLFVSHDYFCYVILNMQNIRTLNETKGSLMTFLTYLINCRTNLDTIKSGAEYWSTVAYRRVLLLLQ